jgi:hypothetical protein
MNIPPSPYFIPLSLTGVFNVDRQTLSGMLRALEDQTLVSGTQVYLGIPFACGGAGEANVILLDKEPITLDVGDQTATFVLFLHIVEDRKSNYQEGLADFAVDGNELGDLVSDYTLEYADGSKVATSILRRFAIQQSHILWGASPFTAAPALKPGVFPTATEETRLRRVPSSDYGRGETRVASARDRTRENLWVYALPNPQPAMPIRRIHCKPQSERSLIFAITLTNVETHPLRPGVRQKLRLTLPPGANLNALGELEDAQIDLGTVISARAALDYDEARWLGDEPVVLPTRSEQAVIIEYAAHPQARLYVPTGADSYYMVDLSAYANERVTQVNPAHRPVKVRVVEQGTQRPATVRIHLHGEHGEYLPPRGNHRKVNPFWFEDNYGEFVNAANQYAYIRGECLVDLPLGEVFVEITRGYEVKPVRRKVTITPETEEIRLEIEKVLRWREAGWVTADTHVHFLSPTTALLEGQAEDVHVVNLLASQWGEMFSNVSDFDGRTTLGAKDFGGDGEYLVRVGTENRMQVLGHISLLGYRGEMIHPLCTGGPSESAIGDPQEVSMAEWAQRCIDQDGLVVMPHAPNPQLERAADIVLGLVHGIEMMTFNPLFPDFGQISPYGVADWYRYLNLGYHVPVVGGSDKMAASSLLGGIRTYAHLGEREFSYEDWMAAVKAGNTFVTVGPLAELKVEGVAPGGRIDLPAGGGALDVTWRVESVSLPIEQVEVVVGGLVVDQVNVGQQLSAVGQVRLPVTESTWVALRVRGSYRNKPGELAAHTSAVMVSVGSAPHFVANDAMAVLEQIEGALAYVDTLAPRPEAQRFKQMRASIEAAYNQLHQRMHQGGIFHRHTPVSGHADGHS